MKPNINGWNNETVSEDQKKILAQSSTLSNKKKV